MKFKGRLSHFRYKPIVLSSLFYYHNAPYSKNVNTIKVLIAILKVKSYINVHAKKKSNTKLYFIIVKKNKNILYLLKLNHTYDIKISASVREETNNLIYKLKKRIRILVV